jgi:hypothetical protein
MDVKTSGVEGIVGSKMSEGGWIGCLPTALVSRVFSFCDLQTHVYFRRCNRRYLTVAQLASSTPDYISFSVNGFSSSATTPDTTKSVALTHLSKYRPSRLHVVFISRLPICTLHN